MDETPFRDALAAGDRRQAAAWLVQTFAGDVHGLCRALVRDHATAEDLTQDTFHKALAGLSEFRGESSARTWLLAIARHRCVDHLRRQGRRPDPVGTDVEPTEPVDDAPLTSDLLSDRTALTRALASLDESSRALVVLRFHHGLGYPELADAYGLKQGAVRMRISRALAAMRAVLTPAPAAAGAALERAYQQGTPTAVPPPARRGRTPAPGAPAAPPVPRAPAAPQAAMPAPSFGDLLGALQPALSGSLAQRLDAWVATI